MPDVLPKPELTSHPVDVGHRAEAAILCELVKRGYRVLLPFGVPADEVPSRGMYLRLNPSRNRQDKRVRWAKDYELPA